jgi:hypothetical protein
VKGMNEEQAKDNFSDVAGRLPHNIEADQALLGATLNNNDALQPVTGLLQSQGSRSRNTNQAPRRRRIKPVAARRQSIADIPYPGTSAPARARDPVSLFGRNKQTKGTVI